MKTVRKLFWAWDFDREEDWLNDMAAQGWGLVDVGFCRYTFEACRPGEYGYRLELLENSLKDPKSQEYLDFLAEAGVDRVGHLFRWVYLRKRTDEGPFELFSDTASRIRHLRRILALVLPILALNLLAGFNGLEEAGFVNLLLAILLAAAIEGMIRQRFSLEVPVYVTEREALVETLRHAPGWWGTGDPAIYDNLIFLLPPLGPEEALRALGPLKEGLEWAEVYGDAIFWSFRRKDYQKTNWWPRTAKVDIRDRLTIRTANTVRKLAEL